MIPTVIVLAKAPVAGRVKTRLTPPMSPDQAAALATAALQDTLDVATAGRTTWRAVLVLEGDPGSWLDDIDIEVLPQRGNLLDARIAAAFEDVGGPAVLIGMDTPQLSIALLDQAVAGLSTHDAVLGLADDGGFWAIGVRAPWDACFVGVPMSRSDTGERQRERLLALGLDALLLPRLRDVDRLDDAIAVADLVPLSRFARTLAPVLDGLSQPAHTLATASGR